LYAPCGGKNNSIPPGPPAVSLTGGYVNRKKEREELGERRKEKEEKDKKLTFYHLCALCKSSFIPPVLFSTEKKSKRSKKKDKEKEKNKGEIGAKRRGCKKKSGLLI
jgi:hypothetical protein